MYQAFRMIFPLNNDTLRLFLAKNFFVQEIIYATPLCVFPCRFLHGSHGFKIMDIFFIGFREITRTFLLPGLLTEFNRTRPAGRVA